MVKYLQAQIKVWPPFPTLGILPVNTTPHITCTQPTYLNFQAIDSRGCISNTDMKIDGPYQNDFDLSVNITATAFRTGIPSMISIDAMNDGCNSQPGTIQLILDSGVIYNWANPAPTVNNGDTLIWNVANINYLNPIFHIDVSATNTLIIPGTQLTFSATVFHFLAMLILQITVDFVTGLL
ncbi:MAG: hypothetical protein IPP32_13025 [Bacteroidetes bacterium]|nr:hypothetical protein [Bacteroidota bacterium]